MVIPCLSKPIRIPTAPPEAWSYWIKLNPSEYLLQPSPMPSRCQASQGAISWSSWWQMHSLSAGSQPRPCYSSIMATGPKKETDENGGQPDLVDHEFSHSNAWWFQPIWRTTYVRWDHPGRVDVLRKDETANQVNYWCISAPSRLFCRPKPRKVFDKRSEKEPRVRGASHRHHASAGRVLCTHQRSPDACHISENAIFKGPCPGPLARSNRAQCRLKGEALHLHLAKFCGSPLPERVS